MLDQKLIRIFRATELIFCVLKLLAYVAILIIGSFQTLIQPQTLCLSLDGNLRGFSVIPVQTGSSHRARGKSSRV